MFFLWNFLSYFYNIYRKPSRGGKKTNVAKKKVKEMKMVLNLYYIRVLTALDLVSLKIQINKWRRTKKKKTIRYIKENVFIHLCFSLDILIPVTVIYGCLDKFMSFLQNLLNFHEFSV